jgi:hypothetical protein
VALKISVWLLSIGVSAAVFMLYARADFMVGLANQVWGCF